MHAVRLALGLAPLVVWAPTPATAQSTNVNDYVLFADQVLRTKGVEVDNGDIAVNQAGGKLSASSHGRIEAPHSDVVTDTIRASDRSVCGRLFSNVIFRAMAGCTVPTGAPAVTFPLVTDLAQACGFPDIPAPSAPDPCSLPEEDVVFSGIKTLTPNSYGPVDVKGAGGKGGTLILESGDYTFCSLRAGRNSRILFKGPVTVKIARDVNISNSTVTGPHPDAAGLSALDIRFFVKGSEVHFSRRSEVHMRLCAPNASLRMVAGTLIEGTFAARFIRTERVIGALRAGPGTTTTTTPTATTTTTSVGGGTSTSTTTTTQTGGSTTTATTVTTTTTRHATTTTQACSALCGNHRIDAECGEVCDGPAPCSARSPGGALIGCSADCRQKDTSACPSAIPEKVEICGNCIDDDGNGKTDFEDPACCTSFRTFTMTVRRGRLRPRGQTTGLRLKTILADTGLANVNPLKEDVFLQIRPQGGGDILCAKVPATKFMRMHGAFKFWDRKHTVKEARGIDDLRIKVRRDSSVRLRTIGRHVDMQMPGTGPLQVTVGFRDGTGDAQNMCSTQTQPFRTGRAGRLLTP